MVIDWLRVGFDSGIATAVLGVMARQIYLKGKNDQKFKDMEKSMAEMKESCGKHEDRLNNGSSAFARIDATLASVEKSQSEIKTTVEAGFNEVRRMLIQHINGGSK